MNDLGSHHGHRDVVHVIAYEIPAGMVSRLAGTEAYIPLVSQMRAPKVCSDSLL